MRLVHSYRVKDSFGSEIALFEYRAFEVRKLLGILPIPWPARRFVLDTGEVVERIAGCGTFRFLQSGEQLTLID